MKLCLLKHKTKLRFLGVGMKGIQVIKSWVASKLIGP